MYPYNEDGNFELEGLELKLVENLNASNIHYTWKVISGGLVLVLDRIGKVSIRGDKVSVILLDYHYLKLRLLIEGLFRGRNNTSDEWAKACV